MTPKDIIKLTKSGTIRNDLIIRGEHIKTLTGVKKIKGSLGLSDSSLESLGDLKEIKGDFWISAHTVYPCLTPLCKLDIMGGDASFHYSNIIDLDALKKVGGKLVLKDTAINNLGLLTYVGGDLYLPKRLKDKLDLSEIIVHGKVRYWKDSKTKKIIVPKAKQDLEKYPPGVPYWKFQYIYSVEDLENASYEHQHFYKIYKQKFKKSEFLDLEGNYNYSFILYYDLLSENSQPDSLKELQMQFKNLEKFYPGTKGYTQSAIIEKMENNDDYENAWRLKYNEEFIKIQTIIDYEHKLQRPLLDGELIVKLAGYSHLTVFGQNNIEEIKRFAKKQFNTYERRKGMKFFELFLQYGRPYQTIIKSANTDSNKFWRFFRKDKKDVQKANYDVEYYKQFYLSKSEYKFYKGLDDMQRHSNINIGEMPHVIKRAILNQLRLILKEAEDLYRASIGMPKVGEGWISETELFYKITQSFREYKVIHHGTPDWLGRQHLDIYFPQLNIGLEYQGAQHYEPIDFFGGQEAFE
ncbi:MAG: hypothetical protein WB996_00970, partial [Ignavibacteriaceae bacterium]